MIGSGGAGKSTAARRLAAATGLPLVHLDREYWHPGWRPTPPEDWRLRVSELIAAEHWVLDGKDMGPADGGVTWAPRPGKHELKLVGSDGRTVAAAPFEVRGADGSGQPASTFSTSSGGSPDKSSGSGVNSGESER